MITPSIPTGGFSAAGTIETTAIEALSAALLSVAIRTVSPAVPRPVVILWRAWHMAIPISGRATRIIWPIAAGMGWGTERRPAGSTWPNVVLILPMRSVCTGSCMARPVGTGSRTIISSAVNLLRREVLLLILLL